MRCHIDSSIQTFIDNNDKQTRVKMRDEAMRQRISLSATTPNASLPSLFLAHPAARALPRNFFSSHIRNTNTRRAYREAVPQFSGFCAGHGIVDFAQVEPVHVAAFVEAQLRLNSKPTVQQRLAALRMLFDWMAVGQVLPVNPAHAVRGPKHSQRRGKTPVLQADEARALLDARWSMRSTSLPCPACATGR